MIQLAFQNDGIVLPSGYQRVMYIGKNDVNAQNNPAIKLTGLGNFLVGDTMTIAVKRADANQGSFIGGVYSPQYGDPGSNGTWGAKYNADGTISKDAHTPQCTLNVVYGSYDIVKLTKTVSQSKVIMIGALVPEETFFEGSWQRVTWERENTVIADLIPCYRISDSEIGMYDIINNIFYARFTKATGSFIKGPDV
jgi:hypothetical protein